jgi:NADH-quinone oxidoreductase subunit N
VIAGELTSSPLMHGRHAAGVTLAGVPAIDWFALAPVIAPVGALLVVLLIDAIVPGGRAWRRVMDVVSLVGLGGAGVAVAMLAVDGTLRATACVSGSDTLAAQCSYLASGFTLALQAIVLLGAIGCLLLAIDGPGARDRTPHHVLLLAAVSGALALAGARDLATLVVALETASLPAIGLVALRRDAQGAQAGVTMLLTAVGSLGLLLLGVSLIFLATGSLHLTTIATTLGQPGLDPAVLRVAGVGTALAIAGIGFKISLVPFHLWTPDTYAGAPLPIAAFLSTVSKAAGVAALAVLLGIGLPPLTHVWSPIVSVLALITMTAGNLVALRQRVAVRLLAWSTVAQAGWVLVPLASADGTQEGIRTALAASLGYLLAYTVASLAAFTVVVLVARHHPAGEEHTLDAYRGLARTEPVASAVLAFALACLAGLPPGVMGLIAKVVALRPLVDQGVWPIAVIAALNVALGLAYYVRWAGLLVSSPVASPPRWRVRPAEGLVLGGAGAACVGLSVAGQVIADLLPTVLR